MTNLCFLFWEVIYCIPQWQRSGWSCHLLNLNVYTQRAIKSVLYDNVINEMLISTVNGHVITSHRLPIISQKKKKSRKPAVELKMTYYFKWANAGTVQCAALTVLFYSRNSIFWAISDFTFYYHVSSNNNLLWHRHFLTRVAKGFIKTKVGISKELESTPTSAAAQCSEVVLPGLQGRGTALRSANRLDASLWSCVWVRSP